MKRLLLAVLLVVFPGVAFAADGDLVGCYTSGQKQVCEVLLCDGDHTAPNTDCAQFDLHSQPSFNGWPGMPNEIVYEVRTDNCTTTNTGFVQGVSTSGGTAHNLHTTAFQLGVSASSLYLPFTHRYIRFDITAFGSTGACDDFEVVMRLIYNRFVQ